MADSQPKISTLLVLALLRQRHCADLGVSKKSPKADDDAELGVSEVAPHTA
jgi:hypothetical protein